MVPGKILKIMCKIRKIKEVNVIKITSKNLEGKETITLIIPEKSGRIIKNLKKAKITYSIKKMIYSLEEYPGFWKEYVGSLGIVEMDYLDTLDDTMYDDDNYIRDDDGDYHYIEENN